MPTSPQHPPDPCPDTAHSPLSKPTPTAAGLWAARRTRAAAVMTLVALAGLCVGWERFWAPVVPGGSWILSAKCLPLLFALPGLVRMRMYTYRWLALLVWLYLTEGLVRVSADSGLSRYLAGTEVVLGLALFIACTMHIRLRLNHAHNGVATDAR